MKKYKVEFYYKTPAPHHCTLGYGSYVRDGEKYVVFDEEHPRLYSSRKRAVDSAAKISVGYVNASLKYRIVGVTLKEGRA